MKQLIFSANWGSNENKAWSGTVPGLYRHLQKYYETERFDISVRNPLMVPFRCMEKLGIGRYDMVYMDFYSRIFARRYQGRTDCTVFQFDECPRRADGRSYIFQDLSIGFLLDVYEHHPDMVPYCGLDNLSLKYLQKRAVSQERFYRDAAGIFTMGQWLADYLVETQHIPADKVHAVGGGINVDAACIDHSAKQGNKLLFIGRDFNRKAGNLVIEAFGILKKHRADAQLYIAGPSAINLPKDASAKGIYFVGEQSAGQLVTLYNQCDVFCMPSHFEAYGLVFAEALSFGLPCIGRNAFSMKEFIREGINGYLIDSDDARILADKMGAALDNRQMQEYVRDSQQYYLEQYSWDAVAQRIAEVIG